MVLFWTIDFVFSWFFHFPDILCKCNFPYMIIYVKSIHFVDYNIIGWGEGVKSPLICLLYRLHLQAAPKVSMDQSSMGLMYWTYVLRIWKKKNMRSISYFFLNQHWITRKNDIYLHRNKSDYKSPNYPKMHLILFDYFCRFQICNWIIEQCSSFSFIP